jgi:hypothetical protein
MFLWSYLSSRWCFVECIYVFGVLLKNLCTQVPLIFLPSYTHDRSGWVTPLGSGLLCCYICFLFILVDCMLLFRKKRINKPQKQQQTKQYMITNQNKSHMLIP